MLIGDVKEIPDEVRAWLATHDIGTTEELIARSKKELEALTGYESYFLWDIEDALKVHGLELSTRDVVDKLVRTTLDEWVERLVSIAPHARSLTNDHVRTAMEKQGFDMSLWDGALPLSYFKDALRVIAPSQPEWLYYSDWRWSREDAARVFERWLNLPKNHLKPAPDLPLALLPGDANSAAQELGTSENFIETIPPYDDDFVFALMSPALRDALITGRVLAAQTVEDHQKRGEPPLTIDASMSLYEIAAFDIAAESMFQNMSLRTVADLLEKSAFELRKEKSPTGVVEHIEDVLRRAGLRLSD